MTAIRAAAPLITRLILQDFRTYAELDLAVSRALVALVGENGAGKTNLLEALSLFMPGRGLRRADLADMARHGGSGGFAVSLDPRHPYGENRLGTGLERAGIGRAAHADLPGRRASRLRRPSAFAEYLRVVWLTPDLDALFRGPAGRPPALSRSASCWRSIPSMARGSMRSNGPCGRATGCWRKAPTTALWLDAIEREVAELAIAVASARRETVQRLGALILVDPRRRNRRFRSRP